MTLPTGSASPIYDELNHIMETYPIKEALREKGFSRYAQTTQTLFKVVGISDYVTHRMAGLTVEEIPPTTIKKILARYGFSSKDAVGIAYLMQK